MGYQAKKSWLTSSGVERPWGKIAVLLSTKGGYQGDVGLQHSSRSRRINSRIASPDMESQQQSDPNAVPPLAGRRPL